MITHHADDKLPVANADGGLTVEGKVAPEDVRRVKLQQHLGACWRKRAEQRIALVHAVHRLFCHERMKEYMSASDEIDERPGDPSEGRHPIDRMHERR